MVTFYEWLNKKKGVVEVSRLGMMTHEELPDVVPDPGQIVILMDKPKATITNADLYYVMSKDGDNVILVPKAAIDKSNPSIGEQVKIPRDMWNGFTIINHLLTRKEKMERMGGKPTWIIGANKDRWIANREAELRRQKSATGSGMTSPEEIKPFNIAQIRQQLGSKEEDPQVTAARSWLRGG